MSRLLSHRISRFAIVGFTGFAVDAGLTTTLVGMGVDPFTARVFAIILAVLITWRLNRVMTFGESETSQASEGLRYGIVAAASAGVNYSCYAAIMLAFPACMPAFAIALATGVSMFVSYIGFSRFAFQKA